jgi:hypothetical protein
MLLVDMTLDLARALTLKAMAMVGASPPPPPPPPPPLRERVGHMGKYQYFAGSSCRTLNYDSVQTTHAQWEFIVKL